VLDRAESLQIVASGGVVCLTGVVAAATMLSAVAAPMSARNYMRPAGYRSYRGRRTGLSMKHDEPYHGVHPWAVSKRSPGRSRTKFGSWPSTQSPSERFSLILPIVKLA